MDRQHLRRLCAFQLGMEQQLKLAQIDGSRRQIVLDLASTIAQNPNLTNPQLLTAVKEAAATHLQQEQKMPELHEKTAEERNADAFEYGIGLMLKEAGITDPQEVQHFMQFAAALAAEESAGA